jgi:hypothetical protein
VVQVAQPSDALKELCDAPVFKPTLFVGDMQDNKITAEAAFDKCAARMRCLVWWLDTADHQTPPAECNSGNLL